jgi:hypothetical protein
VSFVLAGAIVIAVPLLFYIGRRDSLECHAASILFAASHISADAIPLNAALLFFFEPLLIFQPGRLPDCRAAIYSFGWRNTPIAMPQSLKRPARDPDFRAAIFFEEASAISQSPRCDFSFGQRDPWPAQSVDSCDAIFHLAGAIRQLPRHDFSFGRRDPLIAALRFFFWPAQSANCCASIFLLASVIL